MNNTGLKKFSIIVLIAYIITVIVFYHIAHDQIIYKTVPDNMFVSDEKTPVGEIVEGTVVLQPFIPQVDILDSVSILTATYERVNKGTLFFQILDMEMDSVIREKNLDLQDIPNTQKVVVEFEDPIKDVRGKELAIKVTSNGTPGNAVTIWQNVNTDLGYDLILNGNPTGQILCFSTSGREYLWFGQNYYLISFITGLILLVYLVRLNYLSIKGNTCLGLRIILAFTKYKFLLKQLVSRDFKTKYKRSVLGILWSFLNPLLTMAVQYTVFSSLFRFDIENFAIYLLIGIIFFSFFSEAVSMSLMSIVGNATLISKVYIPKYIFPISRVISSFINFSLSLIPLMVFVIITDIIITPAIILLLFSITCVFLFSIGLGMLLSSAMVFFRDTQFLWNVVGMLWMYLTPIFYPVSIIPDRYMTFYKLNPMYHFIDFSRIVIMNGVSPEPSEYLVCIISAIIMLAFGSWVFKKTQNNFVLHV